MQTVKKRNEDLNERCFLGAKRKWATERKWQNRPPGFLLLLFVLGLSFSYGQQTITGTLTATDAVNSNELVTKSQLDAVSASVTDDQALSLTGNTLTLENGGTVDLTPYLDNTDGQTITDFSLSGSILSLTLSGGNTQTVDLGSLGGGGSFNPTITSPQLNDIIGYNGTDFVNLPLNITAATTSYDNTTSGLAATDVKAAIDEMAASGGSGESNTKNTSYITASRTLQDADFKGAAEVQSIVGSGAGNETITLTLSNAITHQKTGFLIPNRKSDRIVIKPETGVKLRGNVGVAIDTTMAVDSLVVTDMDEIAILKTGDNVFKVTGNATVYENQSDIVIEDFTSIYTTSAATSHNITKPAGVQNGDLLVIICSSDYGGNVGPQWNNTTNKPSGGFNLIATEGTASEDIYTAIYTKIADGTEGSFSTLTPLNTSNVAAVYMRISGSSGEGALGTTYEAGHITTHNISAVTTTAAESLVIGYLGIDSADSAPLSLSSGWTELLQFPTGTPPSYNQALVVFSKKVASAGSSGSATITLTNTDGASGRLVEFLKN